MVGGVVRYGTTVRYKMRGHTYCSAALFGKQFGIKLPCLQGGDGILVIYLAIFLSCQYLIKSCDNRSGDRRSCFIVGSFAVKSYASEVILYAELCMLPLV